MENFGDALKAQIELSGINQSQLARKCGYSSSQISALVKGVRLPKRGAVEAMDEALGAQGLLLRRWADAKRREAQPEWMRRITDVEDQATEIRISQPTILPIVLQSEDYARGILRLGRPLSSDQEIEAEIERRTVRAKHLLRDGGPKITVMLPEHVVRAAPEIAPDALRYVQGLTESVLVQVLPAGVHLAASLGAFRLISFEDRLSVVFVEHAAGGGIVDHPATVSHFSAAANLLQAEALRPVDSWNLIKEI
ncbi:helix-turn-helix domain-containing protein [Nocardiopsis sediminis]|uniref:Helix-turn-helix domain-containing protein n=1 Tax=Nocardiopsis sediminis TaxID=1778267 RepID=A0ABV8FVD5_9ACTN